MPHTSARPQERDRLRKRAVSFAFLCAAGHILQPSGVRAARPAYGVGIAPAALLCAAGHILLSSGERAACLHTGRKSPLRRSYARRGISCSRPMSASPAPRMGRESPLRRRFTSERMIRRGCRPLPVLRLPGGIKAASAAVHANSPQECRTHRKSFATTNNPSA